MIVKILIEQEIDLLYLHAESGVRYWEDAKVNGVEDVEGDLIPSRQGDLWKPIIDIKTGLIVNWETGKTADIHYKVCDMGVYYFTDNNGIKYLEKEGYVPSIMSPGGSGYGDYIIMKINENGFIANWECSPEKINDDFISE